ncbi:serine/threonine-protein kinase/endoribonuclease IRE2-like [Xenia sp. Carnegie-2017]|uniref:serine/threonine-protein kinase/endoribonuclease IRE2-like n=1 Tax=Xenia sp. Carnegie-2017 TaxID=2897299 RepID=UPI001F0362CA|nr:serine/threonine-protein kinase/endoribonuclease IRE2-like [Xenia sp. Carnegie-2017]
MVWSKSYAHEKALKIRKRSLGPNHIRVAASLHNLGLVFEKTGKYDEAKVVHKKALEIRKQSLGPNHVDVAASLYNLGIVLEKTGKQDKAIKIFEKSLEVRKLNVPEITSGDDADAKDVGNSPGVENTKQEITSGDDANAEDVVNSPGVEDTKQEITSGDDANAKDLGNSPGVENTKQETTTGDDFITEDVGNSPGVENTKQEQWKCIDKSTKHRKLLLKLSEYGRNQSVEVKVVGNVRVIFSEEFRIGKGSDATRVFLGLGKDGYGKAVKRIHRDSYIQLALHEKEILNKFNARKSKYVVNYSFLEEETGTEYVYLILDLCEESLESFVESSTLHDLQKALPEILRQILQGLADLHSGPNPILHRDLKPSNVLRDSQDNFLIADFGISRMLNNDCTTYDSKPNMGTEYWIAPESYCEDKDTVDKGRYKKESDVYNAGMVTYYIATKGNHPFGIKRHRLDNMLNGNPVGLDEINDETLKDLLSWMLNREPEDRPSATVALKHPFLMSDDEKFDL